MEEAIYEDLSENTSLKFMKTEFVEKWKMLVKN